MNKQIFADIVNSILGLSKKKKKEFVELLDSEINEIRETTDESLNEIRERIDESLNEIRETTDEKINSIEPSDFEENDETKSSFIKNRPFYDYEVDREFVYKEETYENNINNNQVYRSGSKYIGLYIENNDLTNIKICVVSYINDNDYDVEILNCRYKLDLNLKKVVNYYNNELLKFDSTSSYYFNGYKLSNNKNCKISIGLNDDNTIKQFTINYNTGSTVDYGDPKNYENGILYTVTMGCLVTLKYYKGELITDRYFKQLDEKYIPDSLIQRIEACEQALNITPNS